MSIDIRIAITRFYSLFPPVINPFVYCLRTNEIMKILRRWLQKLKGITAVKNGHIFAVTTHQQHPVVRKIIRQ